MKLYCKISDIFSSFRWFWDFLLENLKLKTNVHWNVRKNILKLYAQNNIFKKGIPNMRFWITYILDKFQRTALGCYCFYFVVVVGQPWWTTILLSPCHHKKASYGPEKEEKGDYKQLGKEITIFPSLCN